jgi:hypothetical protein
MDNHGGIINTSMGQSTFAAGLHTSYEKKAADLYVVRFLLSVVRSLSFQKYA